MKFFIVSFLSIIFSMNGFSQSIFDWSIERELELSDFQSAQTEINEDLSSFSVYSGALMDFSFQMSGYEFMFTKNFNSKVRCTFNRNAAVITAPDSISALQLVKFAQYDFDLAELFARKFRKRLYEEKGTFSDVNYVQPIFDELQEERNAVSARVLKSTDFGRREDLLEKERKAVLEQIDSLYNFCYSCKIPKKRKKKK